MNISPATTTADYRYIAGLYHPKNSWYFYTDVPAVKRMRERGKDYLVITPDA